MNTNRANPEFRIRNRNKIKGFIESDSLAVVTSANSLTRNGDQNFPYRQNGDLFYLTGLDQEQTILTLCPNHPDPALREIVFVTKPNPKIETWTGHKLTKQEVKNLSGIEQVKWLDDFEMTVRDLAFNATSIYLSLNEYAKYIPETTYNDYLMTQKMKQQFPLHQFNRLAPIISKLRLEKQPEEIDLMTKACKITGRAFDRVLKFVQPGVFEYEVEAEMIHEFIKNGARGHAYQPIVASGKSALVLHYIENNKKCKDGDLLLMDFGAEYGNYAADCSRTIPVNGKFNKRQKDCYQAVLKVQKEATKLFTPGNTIDKVNKTVWKMMEEEMIKLGLFSKDDFENQKPDNPMFFKYLMHGVAHFIGLDVHDVGGKFTPFRKGMVLTLEPGLYIAEENIGIRIENNIVVDDTPIDLMEKIPREIEEIESLMNQ